MPGALKTCAICEAPLSFAEAVRGRCCDRPECRRELFTARGRACSVCGRPLGASRPEPIPGVCAAPACQAAHHAEKHREYERQQREALRRAAEALRDRSAEGLGIVAPEGFPVTVIPRFEAKVVNVPERRRRALRDHLGPIISRAFERHVEPEGDPPDVFGPVIQEPLTAPDSPYQAVLGGACGLCRGQCCARGKEHAYLTPDTIRRFVAAHPHLRPRDVLAAYLGRVGAKSNLASCIFHGPAGCTLDRAMRSDTCNNFFCDAIRASRGAPDTPEPARGFFASADRHRLHAAAFVTTEGVTPVPPDQVD